MANNKKVSQRLLTLEHKLERQSDAIKNIQKNVDNTFKNVDNTSKYQDLKQDVLKSQGNVITRWLSVIGIVLIILTTFAGYEVIVIQDNIDSSKELLKKSKSTLIEIQTHEKNAKKLVRKTESSARQVEKQIPRPGVKWSKKTKQEVEKFGTKFQKLRSKIEQENYKTAIDLWKYFIGHAYYENDKKNISIGYFNLGYSYSELKEYQKAIDAYKKVIKIDPNDYKAHNNMGDAYLKLKEYQEAIGAYKEVIKITSDFSAMFDRKLVKIDPSDYKPISVLDKDPFEIGNVFMTVGDIKPISADIAYSMVFGDYDNFKTYDNMGYAYGELKEYQKAIDAYKAAIKIKPNKHETHYNMGNAYRKLKEYQKAIDAYKEAIKIKPDYDKAKRSLKQLKALVLTL
jgi:tetratricopeptide (TPR) repeat protein